MNILVDISLSQLRWVVIPLGKLPRQVEHCSGWSTRLVNSIYGKYKQKTKENLKICFRRGNNSRIPKIYCNWITSENSFSLTDTFLDWKNNLHQRKHSNWKKLINWKNFMKIWSAMLKIWTSQGEPQRAFNMWKVWPKRPRPHRGRLS